jgi:sigma-E factor negative regulatory protein RseB
MSSVIEISSAWKNLLTRAWPLWLLVVAMDLRADMGEPSQVGALRWLTDMRHAVSELNYKGVVAYLKDNQVESFQLFHASKSGLEQERLVSMNSPLREVVRSAEKVTCYFPDAKKVFVENKPTSRSVLLELPEDLTQLARYYRVNLQGQEYVARRLSQVVGIEPRDDYRYARLIWVDSDSKLPLKFEMLDEDGQTVEQMVFTSLSVEQSIPREDLDSSIQADAFTWQINQRETLPVDSLRWTLVGVPEGFQIVSYARLKRPPADHSVEHILLSDGFSSVSIYIEGQKGGLAREHPRKIGAINAHSVKIGDYFITVMGEVPAKTVQVIANGLRYQDKHEP